MVKTLFKPKETLRGVKWQKSRVMDKLLSNEKIATALNQKREKKQFYSKFREKFKGHKATTTGMKEFFWDLKHDKTDDLSDKEVGIIARQVITSGKRYIKPAGAAQRSGPPKNSNHPGPDGNKKINYAAHQSIPRDNFSGKPEPVQSKLKLSSMDYGSVISRSEKETGKAAGKKSIYSIIKERNQGNSQ